MVVFRGGSVQFKWSVIVGINSNVVGCTTPMISNENFESDRSSTREWLPELAKQASGGALDVYTPTPKSDSVLPNHKHK